MKNHEINHEIKQIIEKRKTRYREGKYNIHEYREIRTEVRRQIRNDITLHYEKAIKQVMKDNRKEKIEIKTDDSLYPQVIKSIYEHARATIKLLV